MSEPDFRSAFVDYLLELPQELKKQIELHLHLNFVIILRELRLKQIVIFRFTLQLFLWRKLAFDLKAKIC